MKRSPMPPRRQPMKRSAFQPKPDRHEARVDREFQPKPETVYIVTANGKHVGGRRNTRGFTAEVRRAARERDGGCILGRYLPEHVCRNWSLPLGDVEVHHRKLRRHKDHTLDNAACLCQEGHLFVHNHVPWSRSVGLLLLSTDRVTPL